MDVPKRNSRGPVLTEPREFLESGGSSYILVRSLEEPLDFQGLYRRDVHGRDRTDLLMVGSTSGWKSFPRDCSL